ncbi:MAG: amylo-alpha-1,6-glucosidase [Bacteroidaceae bacterium]|nr:amylo-alpha-1,6-glucosidase [Bacteroidaceae bacterium]
MAAYISYDKVQMTNLQESLPREILCTNDTGAYCCTTIVGCNIRKYHGLLVMPIPEIDNELHVLLSSLDETIIQHGAEFNMGVHKYQGNNYSPNGHKYIRSFEWKSFPTTIYNVGGVVLQKEIHFRRSESRVIIRYTLLDAHSATTLRLNPFLAYRSVRTFTHKNDAYDGTITPVKNGIKMNMYEGYPDIYMQINKKAEFVAVGDWYMGLDYPKERERGYESNEDLYHPGYFEMPIKKGETICFSAGVSEIQPNQLKRIMDIDQTNTDPMDSFYNCLHHAAHQFRLNKKGENYIIAGYPWFKCRARDFFVSMPGLTLSLGETEMFELYMKTASKVLLDIIDDKPISVEIFEADQPDVPLWALWCIQQYYRIIDHKKAIQLYGDLVEKIMTHILNNKYSNLAYNDNGLLSSEGHDKPITWMNSVHNGQPIVPRSGYIVEFNALWYNALRFYADILKETKQNTEAQKIITLAEKVERSFQYVFVNDHGYLYDYVDNQMVNWEVRPNMIFAVALDYSPLTREQRKRTLDICTRELVTRKGLRSLSPKSGGYNPIYVGHQWDRDSAYHQGTAWPWLTGFYLEAYLKVNKMSGISFIERQLVTFEEELFYHNLGSIPELFDGNPPFHGRGAVSYAMNVASILRAIRLLDSFNQE